jgi:hypothetical protein
MSSGDILRRNASRDASMLSLGTDLIDDDADSDISLSGPAVRISGPLFLYGTYDYD